MFLLSSQGLQRVEPLLEVIILQPKHVTNGMYPEYISTTDLVVIVQGLDESWLTPTHTYPQYR